MPWFKVDDNLSFHHKVVAVGNAAMGLWVRAGALSANQLTDGFVPHHMVSALDGKRLAPKLVEAGLWSEVEGGYQFHEWAERQPSREHVEAERAAARERMANRRKNKRQGSGEVRANTERSSEGVREPRPDPTRPVVPNGTTEAAKRAHQLPPGWQPNDGHMILAAENRLSIEAEAEQFVDHHTAKGSTMKDWDAAFRTWLRNAAKWRKDQPAPARPRLLPEARDIELPPDGLSPEQYAAWDADRRARQNA